MPRALASCCACGALVTLKWHVTVLCEDKVLEVIENHNEHVTKAKFDFYFLYETLRTWVTLRNHFE